MIHHSCIRFIINLPNYNGYWNDNLVRLGSTVYKSSFSLGFRKGSRAENTAPDLDRVQQKVAGVAGCQWLKPEYFEVTGFGSY